MVWSCVFLSFRSPGAIPESLGGLTNLTKLSLFKNQLSGDVPLISSVLNVSVAASWSMCLLAARQLSLSSLIGGIDAKMWIVVAAVTGCMLEWLRMFRHKFVAWNQCDTQLIVWWFVYVSVCICVCMCVRACRCGHQAPSRSRWEGSRTWQSCRCLRTSYQVICFCFHIFENQCVSELVNVSAGCWVVFSLFFHWWHQC